jgi:Flp pilus assembly protein CpaB
LKVRWQAVLAVAIILVGVGGLIAYDYYIRPVLLAKTVVMAKEEIAENQVITEDMLVLASVPNDLVPAGAIARPEGIIGKAAIVSIGAGTMLTKPMVDIEGLLPKKGEVIFPIPKEAIFAVNGSLRKRDVVDISLISSERAANEESVSEVVGPAEPIIKGARVVYARTEDNQSVKDSEKGDVNQRETATGRVATVEILITEEERDRIIREIEFENRLWIARVGK